MGPLKKRGKIIWNIPRLLRNTWVMLKNPRVPADIKLIVLFLGVGYLIWPFDLIPEIPIPLLGYIDDLSVIFFLLNWFVNRASREEHVEAEYYYIEDENNEQ